MDQATGLLPRLFPFEGRDPSLGNTHDRYPGRITVPYRFLTRIDHHEDVASGVSVYLIYADTGRPITLMDIATIGANG